MVWVSKLKIFRARTDGVIKKKKKKRWSKKGEEREGSLHSQGVSKTRAGGGGKGRGDQMWKRSCHEVLCWKKVQEGVGGVCWS